MISNLSQVLTLNIAIKKNTSKSYKFKPRIGGVQSWLYAGYLKFLKQTKIVGENHGIK